MVDVSLLRPLYRYMKNDLNRLQLHCKNREYGCEMICSLESIDRHERECEYSQIRCSNAGCTVQIERRNLDGHLAVCEYRSRECPNGCGYTILSAEDAQHNCVAELRTELELLRSEMICRVEEAKHEMESRLDSQRRHMVQKESILQNEIEELKSHRESDVTNDVRCTLSDGCRETASPGAGAGRAGKTGVNGAAEGSAEGLSINYYRRKQEVNKFPPSDATRERQTKTSGSYSYLNRSLRPLER
ncbi:RING finger protein 151 [Patagioenas fasciata monilis]|uniref:RING finger protein 151 n=1 Tax=Patagioenas fasciata monilis TaxID=372326 RepID=A0A1V4KH31_PATFA|nr:RING finger protein 151 [Patagioenas fasciata monilis]